jgi:hypothetical protein
MFSPLVSGAILVGPGETRRHPVEVVGKLPCAIY